MSFPQELARRRFLKLSTAGVLAAFLPLPARALASAFSSVESMPSRKITLGVIGCGWRGGELLINALGSNEIRVIATCDADLENARSAATLVDGFYGFRKASGISRGCSVYQDFRELLARSDIDAVIIATPDHWHALMTVAAVNQGKDVYVEKPLARSIPEGRAVVEAVSRTGAVVQVGSQQRSMRSFQRVVELARNGHLGKIDRVMVHLPRSMRFKGGDPMPPLAPEYPPAGFDYDLWLGPAPQVPYFAARCDYNWRWSYDYSGGQVSNWIGHHYDIAAWALGLHTQFPVEIFNARAAFPKSNPLFNTATDFSFSSRYADGQVIDVLSSASEDAGVAVRIEGSSGWVESSRSFFRTSSEALRRVTISAEGFRCTSVNHLSDFLYAVRNRTESVCPVGDGHRIAAVAHLANAAFRSGRSSVRFDADTERIVGAPDAAALLVATFRAPWSLPV